MLIVGLSLMTLVAGAVSRTDFVGVDAVETSDIMYSKAEMAPLDMARYEVVASQLKDLADFLYEQGDTVAASKITRWLFMNKKYFTNQALMILEDRLKGLSEDDFMRLAFTEYKDPTVSLIVSILVGGLGIDRFIIGDIGLGIGKLLTAGGLGVWWLVDIFCIEKATKNKNLEELDLFLSTIQ